MASSMFGPYLVEPRALGSFATINPLPSVPTLAIHSPADDGIQPTAGDDTTPPNAIPAGKLNILCAHAVANVGFSTSAKQENVPPSAICYAMKVREGTETGTFGLEAILTLEYTNPHPGESMVVWMKKLKQFISDEAEAHQELILIDTRFQDFVEDSQSDGHWVDISTTICYAEQAEAVVQAVIQSESGQTAGSLKTVGSVEEAKLGPVGSKGRIILSYHCRSLYQYAWMAMPGVSAKPQSLIPLAVWLPLAPLEDHMANMVQLELQVDGPQGACLLDASDGMNRPAVDHLQSLAPLKSAMVLLPHISDGCGGTFQWPCLPPMPWCVLFWMCVPASDWDVIAPVNSQSSIKVHIVPDTVARHLRIGLPGPGCSGELVRATVYTAAPTISKDVVRVLFNLLFSDASGSTGCSVHSGAKGTVRSNLNELAVRRFVKRLEAIPMLLANDVLQPHDVLVEVVYIFDGSVRQDWSMMVKAGDLANADIVKAIAEAVAEGGTEEGATTKIQSLASSLDIPKEKITEVMQDIWTHVKQLRSPKPGGCTSFSAPAQKAASDMPNLRQKARQLLGDQTAPLCLAYVNFDTDGGNNCGPCYTALRTMVEDCRVVGGCVTGFGAWVDQDCATKVAAILNGPCVLSLEVPAAGSEGLDLVFRQDLNGWIKALRTIPISITMSAGGITWETERGSRTDNAADLVVARPLKSHGDRCKWNFGPPDISAMECTGAILEGLNAGDSFMAYFVSRVPAIELVNRLKVKVNGNEVTAEACDEAESGLYIAHDWLAVLQAPASQATNKAVLGQRLRERIEDDLSFTWNLPAPSGSTACLGRATTTSRPPVFADHQPKEPKLEIDLDQPAVEVVERFRCLTGSTSYCKSKKSRPMMPRALTTVCSPDALRMASLSAVPGRNPQKVQCFKAAPKYKLAECSSGSVSSSHHRSSDVEQESAPNHKAPTVATPTQILKFSSYLRLGNTPLPSSVRDFSTVLRKSIELMEQELGIFKPCDDFDYTCDGCENDFEKGQTRHRCLQCVDFDLCDACHSAQRFPSPHQASHKMQSYIVGGQVDEDPLTSVILGSKSSAGDEAKVIINKRIQNAVEVIKFWRLALEPVFAQLSKKDLFDQLIARITCVPPK